MTERVEVRRFPETRGGPNRVAVAFTKFVFGELRQVETCWDGEVLTADPRRNVPRAPWVYRLPDGRLLSVHLAVTHQVLAALEVRIDGRPLPGSAGDPARYLLRSAQILALSAGVEGAAAALAWIAVGTRARPPFLAAAVVAALLVAASFGVRRGSRAAGIVAVLLAGGSVLLVATGRSAACCVVPPGLAALVVAADALLSMRRFAAQGLTAGS